MDINEINQMSFEYPSPTMLLESEIDHGRCWVAVDHEMVVGFLVSKILYGVPYVYNVAVASSYRNNGIATQLFKKFEEHYKLFSGRDNYWLKVDENNSAKNLYLKLGYKVDWIEPDFYGKGKNALCMSKKRSDYA